VTVSNQLTIGEFLIGILPRLGSNTTFPRWPPDCFGLCLSLLKRTGAYAQLLRDRPPWLDRNGSLEAWRGIVRDLGGEWKKRWQLGKPESFDDLAVEWQIARQAFSLPLSKTRDQRSLCEALIRLVAVADQACEGVGAPKDQSASEYNPIQDVGADFLIERGTLCLEVDPSRLRVLPRRHTPQNGLSERSLSLNLSLCEASEVTPDWLSYPFLQTE